MITETIDNLDGYNATCIYREAVGRSVADAECLLQWLDELREEYGYPERQYQKDPTLVDALSRVFGALKVPPSPSVCTSLREHDVGNGIHRLVEMSVLLEIELTEKSIHPQALYPLRIVSDVVHRFNAIICLD